MPDYPLIASWDAIQRAVLAAAIRAPAPAPAGIAAAGEVLR